MTPTSPGGVVTPGRAAGRRCGVVGHPAAHSLSPALHRAAYSVLGLDWHYETIDVAPGDFDRFVAHLDRDVWRGLSVTMPHKPDCARHGTPDPAVRRTGVANTLVLGQRPDADQVSNTDVPGFIMAIRDAGIQQVANAVVVGNGATAVSAVVALCDLGADHLTVVARRPDRAQPLIELADELGARCTVARFDQIDQISDADIVMSTVPAGAADPHAAGLADLAPVVFEVLYHPWPTPLITAAGRRGATVLDGVHLLAAQARDQLRLMTTGFVPASAMDAVTTDLLRHAGLTELRRRGQAAPPTLED